LTTLSCSASGIFAICCDLTRATHCTYAIPWRTPSSVCACLLSDRHSTSLALAEWLCRTALIGSIRRECVDHIIVLGEMHLRRILKSYADYYNDIRTHRSLNKDAPVSRPVHRTGVISSHAILGGLHHRYARV
jgi:hypothetical protein